MKVIYSFMIGLILFNFYACTKQQIEEPLTENAKLEITYLDEYNKPTEKRTDNILMKLKDDENGFIMVSKKTGENEYTDYLIDNINNSTISMYYTNKSNFPHKIVVIQSNESGETSMVGYTSKYREDTKDFDIIWEMLNGSTTENETFKNISAANLFNHAKTSGVDENTDYQIMTLKVSVRIADAINKYVENNDSPLTRGFWSKFCNFWKKVFKPIVRVVTIIVAVFVPPVAAIITTVVKVADAIINTIDNAINKTEEAVKVSSGPKKLYILKAPNNIDDINNRYKDKDIIYLTNRGDTRNIIFEVPYATINNFKGRISIPEEKESEVSLANNYYGFKDFNKGTELTINSQSILLDYANLKNTINLLVNKKLNKIGHNVYINIELNENIFINENATNSFQLVLQKDLIE
ncbi:hypothetical protein [uncultured Brachyspira sp.]|uniref:hypothetical protein n=1 Tax=uncultured Brachyspira sp. TaxID=221953 RepID=UPI002594C0A1|nr:hypothetical protein [uncultured Brachyspira sp.]